MAWPKGRQGGSLSITSLARSSSRRRLVGEVLECRVLLSVGDYLRSIDNPSTTLQPLSEAGTSVAVSGNFIAVGAPWDDAAGKSDVGQVHVYDHSTGSLLTTIRSQSPVSGGRFGHSVDVSGSRLVASSPFADPGAADAGLVELFNATDGTPLLTITNPTPAARDYFGQSVAIDGDHVVVGAYLDDTFATDAGVAYVFDANTGSLLHTLSPPDLSSSDYFGFALAISGNTIVVGARRADNGATDDGAVYLFQADTGAFIREIVNPTPENFDSFGRSVAISGDLLVVGADSDDTGAPGAGAAYVFSASSGALVRTLLNPTPAFVDFFGYSVGIDGDSVVVGAIRADDVVTDSGMAYLFSASTGVLQKTWANPTAAELDVFGASAAVSGNTVVVGAYWDDTSGTDAGAAYVFDTITKNLTYSLPNPTLGSFNYFGYSVAVEANLVVVGAPFEDVNNVTNAGEIYLIDAFTGQLLSTISNPHPGTSDNFGLSVAISGSLIAVGAYKSDIGATDSGVAYVFDAATGELVSTLQNPTPSSQDFFGFSVAIRNGQVVVGAYRDDDDTDGVDAGSAYLFDAATGVLLETISNPSPNDFDYFGYSVAISRDVIVIGAYQDDTGTTNAGSVYVYDRLNAESMLEINNPFPEPSDQFGLSIATWGTSLAVGAPRKDLGAFDAGAAYLFHALTGELTFTIADGAPQTGGNFGGALDLSDNLLAVGAHRRDFPSVTGVGSVDLFDATTGLHMRQLIDPIPIENDFFGWSVATGSSITVVGTPLVDGATTDRGAVSLYYSQANAAPFVSAGGPYVGDAGELIQFHAVDVFDDRDLVDSLIVEWDYDYDSVEFNVDATGLSPAKVFESDFATRSVAVRVTDSLGLETIATATLSVGNAGPSLTVDQRIVEVIEAAVATNSGTFADVDTENVELAASDGTIEVDESGRWFWSLPTQDGPEDSRTVTITATNSDLQQSSVSFDVLVKNAPPEIIVSNETTFAFVGTTATNSGVFNDAGKDSFIAVSTSIGTIQQTLGVWNWSLTNVSLNDSQTVTIEVTDSDSETSAKSFALVVTQVIANSIRVAIGEGQTARQSGRYADPGNGTVVLTASVGQVVDNGDGTWNWTHAVGDGPANSQSVTITARYGDNQTFTTNFDVVVANVPPIIIVDLVNIATTVGSKATNTGSYADPGGDIVLLDASLGTVVDNGNGNWAWSFVPDQPLAVGETVTIRATDSDGGVATVKFSLQVANAPPTLATEKVTVQVLEGGVAENVGRFTGVGVELSASVGSIEGLEDGTWNWSLPVVSAAASQTVTITATDEENVEATLVFELVVTKILADNFVVAVDEESAAQNNGRYLVPNAGRRVELSASIGVIVDHGDGTWGWTYGTVNGPQDSATVVITVKYDDMSTFSSEFELVVNNVAPLVAVNQPSVSILAGGVGTNQGTYTDASQDIVSLTASSGTITDNSDGTWDWSFDTTQNLSLVNGIPSKSGGQQVVVVEAMDSDGGVSSVSFEFIVVSRISPTHTEVIVDEAATATNDGSYVIVAGDPVTLSSSIGVIVDNGDGTWSWTFDTADGPDESQSVIVFVDYDSAGRFHWQFEMIVNNLPPTLTVDRTEILVTDGGVATNDGSFADVGSDDVTLSVSIGTIVDQGDGSWNWVFETSDGPDESQTVSVVATDSDGASTEITFELVDSDAGAGPATLDLNNDGTVGLPDLDALVVEVVLRRISSQFDLNEDGLVDREDIARWLANAATFHGYAEPYLLGDASLDGVVNSADLNALALEWQNDVSGWSVGDFTADGRVDSADLNALALNWQLSIKKPESE